jgi:hypothetical protein
VFDAWMAALEARHLADLTFPEVSRALRALSSTYVERRQRIGEGAALSGAGKRAAFALFYGPLHFLLVREIVSRLDGAIGVRRIVDLGCGTGAAGAAWASAGSASDDAGIRSSVIGIDRHPWAVQEAAWTYRTFGIRGRTTRADIASDAIFDERAARVAAFALNELADRGRDRLVDTLLDWHAAGDPVLIVEPLARSAAPWWEGVRRRVEAAGGRADEWRFRLDLPPIVAKLDRACRLDHRELTGRSFWLG